MIGIKKGAIESYFLVTIIIAVVGFVIVIWFLLNLDLSGQSEGEICRLSVLSRASSPEFAQSAVSLKCNTKKICLTKGGECSKNFAGEKPEIEKLSGSDEEIKSKIEKVSADALYDCWKMMGEGKLDLFGKFEEKIGLEKVSASCVICSRIAVDEDIDKRILDNVNINQYMKDNIISELGVNYIYALTGGGAVSYAKEDPVKKNAFEQFIKDDKTDKFGGIEKLKDSRGSTLEFDNNKNNREMAVVFMQVKSDDPLRVGANMAELGGLFLGGVFMSPVGRPIGMFVPHVRGLAVVGLAAASVYAGYTAYQGQAAAVGYCGDFVTNEENGRKGCSILQGINYNWRDINAVCPSIQGNL